MRKRLSLVLKLFLLMLAVYALLRLAFLLIYFDNESWTFAKAIRSFYWGARLDFAALFYINLPFLVYYFFIDPATRLEKKRAIAVWLFAMVNLPFLALNFIDLVYFRYNHRRSTVDLLQVFGDSTSAMGTFIRDYWYVLLLFIACCISLVRRFRKILGRSNDVRFRVFYVLVCIGVLALGAGIARGFSKRPIQPSTPLLYFDARLQPLVNNSTFNFLYSAVRKQTHLERVQYFSDSKADSLYPVRQQYVQTRPFGKRNVVVFVLESFSKEYFDGEQKAQMPFFDSLMRHSTVFDNAFANALESNKGLPAILASLPEVMDEPVYASNYNNNRFRGIGHLLKEKGYNTSFFLGAEYDHFGFARLCKMVGIDKYYSADTYDGKDEHHDGSWGIYDEYFFPYFAREVSKKQQPFFSVLFNISSHYPYKMPDATAARIKVPGQRPQQDGATYVDHCFGRLFYQIRSQPWFSNTLFVFVADHGFRYTTASNEILREIRIPLFVYDPRDTTGRRVQSVVRQLDIVPSILDKLGYSEPFTSFGSSFYREGPGFSVNKIFGVHQFVDSVSLVGYSVEQNQALYYYDYRPDSLLKNNLLQVRRTEIPGKLDRLKAFHQQAVNRLIDNRLDK